MPRISHDTYRIHEVSVSCTDQGRYPHSCANVIDKYPKNTTIIDHLDGEGMGYIDNPMLDLYNGRLPVGNCHPNGSLAERPEDSASEEG